ncbi:hypothetical protein [uncultured Dokdonia sp.]|uniref:hypothetical protein n=1 Tax=uncultured Dokdonia sp. TaxID=575653 RepID=UPI002638B125|nr:hypothetical protein [uncultured Dokdonia sp.]
MYSEKEKKALLESLGVSTEKIPKEDFNKLLLGLEEELKNKETLDIDKLLEKHDLGDFSRTFRTTTDNSDILNLFEQLKKLRKKKGN